MKNNLFKILTALFIAFVFIFVSCGGDEDDTTEEQNGTDKEYDFFPLDTKCVQCSLEPCTCKIISAYHVVDWQNWSQYKASNHLHTTNSDGSVALKDVIEEHYKLGYDIMSVTDHSEFEFHIFTNATGSKNGITAARLAEMTAGTGRNGRGMVIIPGTSEQRVGGNAEEINAFWYPKVSIAGPPWGSDWIGWGTNYDTIMTMVKDANGISFINHPGRTTGGMASTIMGPSASNNPLTITGYVDRYMKFKDHCVGMEIINREDGDSRNDRLLWDNVNKKTIPEGKYVWGFANDDSHSNNAIGVNINMYLMPKNDHANVRRAMINGNFYMQARTVHHEDVTVSRESTAPFPKITNIVVDQTALTITINAESATKIIWIAGGTQATSQAALTATPNGKGNFPYGGGIKIKEFTTFPAVLDLNDLDDSLTVADLGAFVRANIIGPNGIALTQPFGIKSSN